MPLLASPHPQISASAGGCCSPSASLSENTFPSAKGTEPGGVVISPFQKERRQGRRERESLNVGIYLLKHSKEHTSRHQAGTNPSSQGWGALLPARISLPAAPAEPCPPLTHNSSELRSALHCQPDLSSFNGSVIH